MVRHGVFNRKKIMITCVLALILLLPSMSSSIDTALAADAWPGTTSSDIGVNLPGGYEPSGVVWSPPDDCLFCVSDGGTLTRMDTSGNVASNWSPGGDLEAVTVVPGRDSYAYLGIEHPDSIREFNTSTGALTGHAWDLTTWMTGPDNSGLEALTFVPDGYHPYSYDLSSSGGLFFAGLQADAKIYIFNVNLAASGSVSHVATLNPPAGVASDISDLHFCTETNTLYAIYDTDNLMVEMRADGTVLHEYVLPNNDQEGITVIPSTGGLGQAVVAEDTGTVWRWEGYPTTCSDIDASPPPATERLTFIHHSCGGNWLASGNGNLGAGLNAGNYYVTETNYGWDAEPGDNLGDHTDTSDWPLWFNETKMPYVYANSYHSAYANAIADPGGENAIIMFKSCYPLSEVGAGIDDEKAVYNSLLPYFEAHTDKLFVLITPPGETVVSSYVNTRELCDWLVDEDSGWLAGYASDNVMVFDFYGVLSETDSHHRLVSGSIQHAYAPAYDGVSPYHDGDDHPNSQGNQKSTAEFLLLLNIHYNRWKASVADPPTVTTSAASGVTTTTATLNGNITDTGGASCDSRGFDYRVQGAGTWQETLATGTFGTGAYSLGVTHLAPGTTYEFRAKAQNSAGLDSGSTLTFQTPAETPGVSTGTASGITTTSATLGGSITDTGGAECDSRGFDYRRRGSGAWHAAVAAGSFGTGAFSRSVSGLSPGTTYEFRARARNSAGWSYGSTRTFTTTSRTVVPEPFTVYLAEGTTDWGFSTTITITNPNDRALDLDITFMPAGARTKNEGLTVPPLSQTTLTNEHLVSVVGMNDFSTKIECADGYPIAADRTMTWTGAGAPSPEAHSSTGVTEPSTIWYMPEGTSDWGFETWLLVQNPDDTPANCTITYMVEGGAPVVKTEVVPASSRRSYSMLDHAGVVDASIQVKSDRAVICERSVYRNNRREGHESVGTPSPAAVYYLAEGSTDWGFTTYVLIQNPNPAPVDVNVTYLTTGGAVPHPQNPVHMEASSRRTIRVNDFLPNADFSTKVASAREDAPVIAERAMYWGAGTALGEACHDSIGLFKPYTTFYLPDGQADSSYETWTLVANPNDEDVKVTVSYLTPDGVGNVTRTETIPANTRRTFSMASHSGMTGRASTVVTCTTPGKRILVERAMYFNAKGAGTDTVGGFSD